MRVVNHEYEIDNPETAKNLKYRDGFFAQCSAFQPGKCAVSPSKWFVPFSPYLVVNYDPEEYTLIYSCKNWFGGAFIVEDFWILTREAISISDPRWTELFTKYSDILDAVLSFFDQTRIMPTEQTEEAGCKYAPL